MKVLKVTISSIDNSFFFVFTFVECSDRVEFITQNVAILDCNWLPNFNLSILHKISFVSLNFDVWGLVKYFEVQQVLARSWYVRHMNL